MVQKRLVEVLAAEERDVAEVELGQDDDDVLVETVFYHHCVPAVVLTAVDEEERF